MITNSLRHLPHSLLFLAISLAAHSPADAAISNWAVNEGGRMRLVALSPDADGRLRAALEIEPQPGWITYWREPGQSGIPPQITVQPGSDATLDSIGYPVPQPIAVGAVREIGYKDWVSLPIDFKISDIGKPASLKVSASIGLCKDICIPFQADFTLSLPAESQFLPEEQGVVAAAEASLPRPPSADFTLDRHVLSPDEKRLTLRFTLPETGSTIPAVYVTGPSGYAFFEQTNSRREGRTLETEIPIGKLPNGYDLRGKQWSVLVVDGKHAMETPLAFD